MFHICELGTELLESVLCYCNKEAFLLLNQTCHLFVDKKRRNCTYKSIIDRTIEKKVKAEGGKIERPSLACLFYQREIAIEKGTDVKKFNQNLNMINLEFAFNETDSLQERQSNTLKAASANSAIQFVSTKCKANKEHKITNLLHFLHSIAKKDIKAVINSGGIFTCLKLFQTSCPPEDKTIMLRLLAMCKTQKNQMQQIWSWGGWDILTNVLFANQKVTDHIDDLVSSSVLLTTCISLIDTTSINTCKVMKVCETVIEDTIKLLMEALNILAHPNLYLNTHYLRGKKRHLQMMVNNLSYFIAYVLQYKNTNINYNKNYDCHWLTNVMWRCTKSNCVEQKSQNNFENVLWNVAIMENALDYFGSSLVPILKTLLYFEKSVSKTYKLSQPFELTSKFQRIQGLKSLSVALLSELNEANVRSISSNLTKDSLMELWLQTTKLFKVVRKSCFLQKEHHIKH